MIQQSTMHAYDNALAAFQKSQSNFNKVNNSVASLPQNEVQSFSETLNSSLREVQDLQTQKSVETKKFVSGETQNVHDLMLTLQKASVGISMTTAVRNKALEAYRELSRMQF